MSGPIRTLGDLSPRRRQVVELLADGFADYAIASELGISLATVRKVVWKVSRTLDVDMTRREPRLVIVRWVLTQRAKVA